MTKRAQLADGTILEFPDETTDAVIDQTVKNYLNPRGSAFDNVQGNVSTRPDFRGVQGSASTVPADVGSTKRDILLGARSTLEGVAAIPDFVGAPLRWGIEKVTGIPQTKFGDMATAAADRMGLPTPATARERVVDDVGRAISGTAATLGVGGALPSGSRLGAMLTAQPRMQVLSSATGATAGGVVRENGGSPTSQFVATLLGGFAPGGATSASSGLAKMMFRGGEQGRKAVEQAIDDFASIGATPSIGQATGNWRTQGMESLLSGGPTSAGAMVRFAEGQADAMGAGMGRRADQLSRRSSAENAGRAIQSGAEAFVGNTKATKRALYWQADQFIPANTPVGLPNTWQTIVDLTTPLPGAAATTNAMVNSRIANLRQTLEQDLAAHGGQITYDALKRIRTNIGEAISDYSLSPDTPTREYKALYAALSRDMEEAARAQGPAAVEAAKRANNYTRAVADRLELVDRAVQKAGGPEKVFHAAMSGTQDGATTLRAVMQSLPAEGQKAVTAAVIKRMGLATPGNQGAAGETFSAGTFLTNWNRISPEARRALFDRYGPAFSENMDKIARVAERIKTGSKVYANPSGTSHKAAAYTYWTGLAGSLAATPFTGPIPLIIMVSGGLTSRALASFFTNPKAVAWLSRNASKPAGSAMAELSLLAQGDEELAEIEASLRESTRGGQRPPQGPQRQSRLAR